MDPVLSAAIRSWDWRIELILMLGAAGVIYTLGWLRLRRQTQRHKNKNRLRAGAWWRPLIYIIGLLLLALTLMSPIDVLSSNLFTMHMIQHILLVMIIPPLLLLANPLVFILWGMPKSVRMKIGGWLAPTAGFRRFLKAVTGVGLVWLAYVIVIWGWHDPSAYSYALQNNVVHDIEHLSFFVVSMLYWWHIIGAGPRIHKPLSFAGRFAYTIAAIPPIMIAGIAIAFAQEPIYEHYKAVPRLLGLDVMADQQIAGVIMWVPGSMMYMAAALIVVARWLQNEEAKPWLPETDWAGDDALAAPGVDQ